MFFCFALDPPNITYISENMTVNQSESVNLTCRAVGNPKPNITWTKDGTIINSFFTVRGKRDEGLHVCTADNSIGNASSKSVFIAVECKSKCEVSMAHDKPNKYKLGFTIQVIGAVSWVSFCQYCQIMVLFALDLMSATKLLVNDKISSTCPADTVCLLSILLDVTTNNQNEL